MQSGTLHVSGSLRLAHGDRRSRRHPRRPQYADQSQRDDRLRRYARWHRDDRGRDDNVAGGTRAPGSSIGTETINGNYTNHGTLSVEVSPTDADKVVVNGAVDIAGAHLVLTESPATGWSLTHDYTIIDNDGVDAMTGAFASASPTISPSSIRRWSTLAAPATMWC